MKPLDYEEACKALGYGYRVPTTKNGERWLLACVADLLDQQGPEGLHRPRADNIRQTFAGNLGPRHTEDSEEEVTTTAAIPVALCRLFLARI